MPKFIEITYSQVPYHDVIAHWRHTETLTPLCLNLLAMRIRQYAASFSVSFVSQPESGSKLILSPDDLSGFIDVSINEEAADMLDHIGKEGGA